MSTEEDFRSFTFLLWPPDCPSSASDTLLTLTNLTKFYLNENMQVISVIMEL